MAFFVADTSGNLTAAGTWLTTNATGTLVANSAGSTALTTGNLDSATFTPGAITVQGFLVRLSNRASGSPTNTMTLTLRNSTDAVDVQSCVINVSDLPPCNTTDDQGGWIYCRFNSSSLLIAGKAYLIRASLSATTTAVSLNTNGTANNWQHVLVTTTTGAPGAGDNMLIQRSYSNSTSPATPSGTVTVTMDSTAATAYGTSTANTYRDGALHVSKGGVLAYGTAASTNYVLRLAGSMATYSGGLFTMGASGAEIPRSSTAVLEFQCTSDTSFGLFVLSGSEVDMYGLSRTAGKNVVFTTLSANAAAAATTLNVNDDTGWLNGDDIGLASTDRTYNHAEQRTLNADAGATSMTISSGLTNAHGGVAPVVGEVGLLTRNVQFRSTSTTLVTYCYIANTATFRVSWVLFRYAGSNNNLRRTLDFQTTTGTVLVDSCCFRDNEDISLLMNTAASSAWQWTNNVFYNVGTAGAASHGYAMHVSVAQGSPNWVISGNILLFQNGQNASAATSVLLADITGTFNNNVIAGSSNSGINYGTTGGAGGTIGSFSGNIIHSNNDVGIQVLAPVNGTWSNTKVWRNAGRGIEIDYCPLNAPFIIDNFTCTGNVDGIEGNAIGTVYGIILKNGTVAGDTTFAQAAGLGWIAATASSYLSMQIDNTTFGVASGIYVAHSTADIKLATNTLVQLTCRNTTFASTNLYNNTALVAYGSFIGAEKWAQTSGSHRTISKYGTSQINTTTTHSSGFSEQLTPNSATNKLESGIRQYVITNGSTVTPTVWVRKDGTYNGNQLRLIQKANPAIGFNSDVVLDTMTVGANTWEQLTGTTGAATDDGVFQFVVDCDGTAGNAFDAEWN